MFTHAVPRDPDTQSPKSRQPGSQLKVQSPEAKFVLHKNSHKRGRRALLSEFRGGLTVTVDWESEDGKFQPEGLCCHVSRDS